MEELIEEANADWLEMQGDNAEDEEQEIPLPLVRLRVETSTPEGGSFDCENPQRFSNRFVGKVANVNDVVQFHRKKKNTTTGKSEDIVDESAVSQLATLDTVKVEQLVRDFLAAQSLSILPQNSFGDAVSQFIDKDDKHAMEMFVNESLDSQMKHLLSLDRDDEELDDEEKLESSLQNAMEKYRTQMEDMFSRGIKKRTRGKKRFKPKPDGWDTEFDGAWEDQPGALIHSDNDGGDPIEEDAAEDGTAPSTAARGTARGRGRARGRGARGAATTASSRKPATTAKTPKRGAATTARGRRQKVVSDDEDEEDDVVMVDDDDDDDEDDAANQGLSDIDEDDDSQSLFVKQPSTTKSRATRKPAAAASTTNTQRRSGRAAASPAPSSGTARGTATTSSSRTARGKQTTQSTLNFAGSQASGTRARPSRTTRAASAVSEDIDDDDDDDDAFEAMPSSNRRR